MTAWQLRLTLLGLLLVFAGFIFGLAFSMTVDHQPRLLAHDAYQPVFEQIGAGVSRETWQDTVSTITQASIAHRRAADVHGHATNMGILLLLIGLLSPLAAAAGSRSNAVDRGLLLGLAVSSIVYPMGLFLQFLRFTGAGEVVAAVGAVGAIVCMAGVYVRLCQGLNRAVN